ncbi:extracellular solute-binding protein [Leptolyngbya sp. FACHB-261]|uniref:extracellular solute-binding protein n=1 Tax=Leptolyngbya sp. FACHB-261 TaxID=2692806 RepID=UPI001684E54D|nr:extracellular solute-binding protein [Leptolyngbya sp. FACHB-261]MBD2100126.1 extracellular solute-binding protein [Leptolyngbya sp. FACHB-261]
MRRRTLLLGAGALTLSSGLEGCGFLGEQPLQILALQDAIPVQLLDLFRKTNNQKLEIRELKTPAALYASLQSFQDQSAKKSPWRQTPQVPGLASLGDAWLADAVAKQLLRPIDTTRLSNWSNLAAKAPIDWQRSGQIQGQTWGVPFRWGTTAIGYRRDKLKTAITDWADLWQPALKRRLTLPDSPREVIGLVLKHLGASYNTADLNTVSGLQEQLQALQQQVLTYSSDAYLQPLLQADSWAAVGWSADLLRAARQEPELQVVVPRSGTALWIDFWVQPTSSSNSSQTTPNSTSATETTQVESWLNFCLQPDAAARITVFTNGTSPVPIEANTLADSTVGEIAQAVLQPPAIVLQRCEPLLPLSPSTTEQYRQLWQELRTGQKPNPIDSGSK